MTCWAKKIHHFLPEVDIGPLNAGAAVTGQAVDGLHADTVLLRCPDHLFKRELCARVGRETSIKILEITFQILGHYPGAVERIEIRLMEIGEQMLHVQGFDFLFSQHAHVFDQKLFAAHAGVTFTDDQAL